MAASESADGGAESGWVATGVGVDFVAPDVSGEDDWAKSGAAAANARVSGKA